MFLHSRQRMILIIFALFLAFVYLRTFELLIFHSMEYNLQSKTNINPEKSSVSEEEWLLDELSLPKFAMTVENSSERSFQDCANFPDLYTVYFNNIHWQIEHTDEQEYYLFSAFLDVRGSSTFSPKYPFDNAYIRILGMTTIGELDASNSTLKFCQLWFDADSIPVFSKISDVKMLWKLRWGRYSYYFPYIISCRLPRTLNKVPVSVSVVSSKCNNATNNLKIIHRKRKFIPRDHTKLEIAVCVKALDFPSEKMKTRLIEWIETIKLLGARKIFFYEYFVDKEIKKVLDFYEDKGDIHVKKYSLPGRYPNHAQMRHRFIHEKRREKRLTELIPYNDCFYNYMYDYDYIVVMDTDEIIVPAAENTWQDLLEVIKEEDIGVENFTQSGVTTFCFENFYFMEDMMIGKENEIEFVTRDFHMLSHIYRSKISTKRRYMKCFHSAKETLGVHNHYPFYCRNGNCTRHYVNNERAQMNHYRKTCVYDVGNCSWYTLDTARDTKLWRHKNNLISNVQYVLNALGFK